MTYSPEEREAFLRALEAGRGAMVELQRILAEMVPLLHEVTKVVEEANRQVALSKARELAERRARRES
jgi:hypothetical protein